jgi:galactokinase/mevalonate kinase-like predicted kinase
LADQVRKSVRSSKGNQWMFRTGHATEHPIRIHPRLLQKSSEGFYPILQEETSVRMDLTHSAWSDIFFLGMDYPEGARVINVSVDLGVYGRDKDIKPPIESYFRVISEPIIRITCIDLDAHKDVQDLDDLFNFGNDYLSLIKAGIIASGLIPASFEGTNQSLQDILANMIAPGMGFEVVTKVNDIPKGSRLAVSTNLLAGMISLLMRASNQTKELEGTLQEEERRLAASRAILGEWIGGSGGGWQDSGGIWAGIKRIEGVIATELDPEYGISRGCLMPRHKVLQKNIDLAADIEEKLANSLVMMHGGMASNVGPILEMVTEKYLLRGEKETIARQKTNQIYEQILEALRLGDIEMLAKATTANWEGPIKTIIPWATTHYTETLIKKAKEKLGDNYLGFLMMGGMSGGGMGMFVKPESYETSKKIILEFLQETKKELSDALPFAMNPIVYNFRINPRGTYAHLKEGINALMPQKYYALHLPELVKKEPETIPYIRRAEIDTFTQQCEKSEQSYPLLRSMVGNLFRISAVASQASNLQQEHKKADEIKKTNGFDYIQHEQIREDLRKGRIGLARNKLPVETLIEDVGQGDVVFLQDLGDNYRKAGEEALEKGTVAVMTLAAGVGSRWTKGAGVIKAINPFVEMGGTHRSFLELHLRKTKKIADAYGVNIPHIIATSYLTHAPIEKKIQQTNQYGYSGSVYLSSGRSIGQRFVPMVRDLMFLWEETTQETLDENKQKVREAGRKALINWAKNKGEGSDYIDNLASQRFSPLGHWYEVSNLLRNGTLATVLQENPNLKTIMLHNIDTLGADLQAEAIGYHLLSGKTLTFEVVPRHIDDRGGGLARVNGKLRLLEGLAQPREEDEMNLSYYNTMTTWIDIDKLLAVFGLNRQDLSQEQAYIDEAVRKVAQRMPTYVTIKDVKLRWGNAQEDIYPVAQVEKLWSDMTSLSDVSCGYLAVPRKRGQQMKDIAQLDGWANDGSKEYIRQIAGIE